MQPRVELWQLRYFVAVAEELSFRRAAERLSITQPPLTRQIQALEETVGSRLFDRDRGGVLLTSTGNHLLTEARKLLADADAMLTRVKQRAEWRIELKLGITTVLDPALFTWVEPALKAREPSLRVVQKRQYSQRSVADIRRGALDAALIGLPSDTGDLNIERLFADPLVAALPATHTLSRRRRLSLLELAGDVLFWPQRRVNPAYFDHYEKLFQAHAFNPERLPEPADHHVLLSLIAAGEGIALIPASLTSIARAGVVYCALKEQAELRIEVALAWSPETENPALLLLLDVLRERHGNAKEQRKARSK
jgi:DNA-binding transcriptional LysR family regulator